jgi:hypothetical protein
MAKAKFRPDTGAITKVVKVSLTNARSDKLAGKTYRDGVTKLMDELVGSSHKGAIAGSVREALVNSVSKGLDDVSAILKAGVPGASSDSPIVDGFPTGWQALSRDWIRRKRPQSKELFWRDKGNLSKGFSILSNLYGKGLAHTDVHIRTDRAVVGKPYKFRLTYTLPVHKSEVINRIIPLAFADITDYSYMDLRGDTPTTLKIGYLEGMGKGSSRHRPFIARLMASRGSAFHQHMQDILDAAAARTKRQPWLHIRLS